MLLKVTNKTDIPGDDLYNDNQEKNIYCCHRPSQFILQ